MSKTKSMLEHLSSLLKQVTGKPKKKECGELRSLLKELKHRQHVLEQDMENEQDKHRRKQLKREISVIRAQRRKGLKVCRGKGDE